MKARKSAICQPGYWSEQIESEVAWVALNRPVVFENVVRCDVGYKKLTEFPCVDQVYKNANMVLKHMNQGIDYKKSQISATKICELMAVPKSANSSSVKISVLSVCAKDFPNARFTYLIDGGDNILAYARSHHKDKSPSMRSVYGECPVIAIEAIESYASSRFSLGSIMMQVIIEQAMQPEYNGRVCLYSIEDSGAFYLKMGFVPFREDVYLELSSGVNSNGELMFLTDACVNAWKKRIEVNPISSIFSNSQENGCVSVSDILLFKKVKKSEDGQVKPGPDLKKK